MGDHPVLELGFRSFLHGVDDQNRRLDELFQDFTFARAILPEGLPEPDQHVHRLDVPAGISILDPPADSFYSKLSFAGPALAQKGHQEPGANTSSKAGQGRIPFQPPGKVALGMPGREVGGGHAAAERFLRLLLLAGSLPGFVLAAPGLKGLLFLGSPGPIKA